MNHAGYITSALYLIAIISLLGCGETGPKRYAINGMVTYDDLPVPAGTIQFKPTVNDYGFNNNSVVDIKDGYYVIPASQGVIGGSYQVTIFGYDGIPIESGGERVEMGKPIFNAYVKQMDLPLSTSEIDIAVPTE